MGRSVSEKGKAFAYNCLMRTGVWRNVAAVSSSFDATPVGTSTCQPGTRNGRIQCESTALFGRNSSRPGASGLLEDTLVVWGAIGRTRSNNSVSSPRGRGTIIPTRVLSLDGRCLAFKPAFLYGESTISDLTSPEPGWKFNDLAATILHQPARPRAIHHIVSGPRQRADRVESHAYAEAKIISLN